MINFVPPGYVIGVDCYWDNGKPVNSEYFDSFKRYVEDIYRTGKPLEVSLDFINKTFNPVRHGILGHVIRDAEFAFKSHVESQGLVATFVAERQAWQVEHPEGPVFYSLRKLPGE